MQTRGRPQTNLIAVVFHVGAHRLQHSLSVISGERFLSDAHFHCRHQTGEQDRALHLRARSASIPVDAAKVDAAHRHRQPVAVLELELCSHVAQRLGDALHRPAAQARVTNEARREWMRCYHSSHQPRGGSTISAVERFSRLAQAA